MARRKRQRILNGLKKLKVTIEILEDTEETWVNGEYNPNTNTIQVYYNPNKKMEIDDILGTLLHEIGHAIQSRRAEGKPSEYDADLTAAMLMGKARYICTLEKELVEAPSESITKSVKSHPSFPKRIKKLRDDDSF